MWSQESRTPDMSFEVKPRSLLWVPRTNMGQSQSPSDKFFLGIWLVVQQFRGGDAFRVHFH